MKIELIYPAMLELARINAESYLATGDALDGGMAHVYFIAAYGLMPVSFYEDIYGDIHGH